MPVKHLVRVLALAGKNVVVNKGGSSPLCLFFSYYGKFICELVNNLHLLWLLYL